MDEVQREWVEKKAWELASYVDEDTTIREVKDNVIRFADHFHQEIITEAFLIIANRPREWNEEEA